MRRSLKRRTRKKRVVKQRGGNPAPSVAIYFSGRINGYENIKDKLLELKAKYNATIFCSLNRATKNQYIRTFQKAFDIDDDRINIEKTPIPEWLGSCEKHPNATSEHLYSALYHNKRNFDMIEAYEAKFNKKFDIVLFYRADIDSNKTIDLLHFIEKNTIYIPGFEGGWNPPGYTAIAGINGMLAYGNSDSMKIYSNAVNSIEDICKNKLHPLQHEGILYTHLKKHKMNMKDIEFKHDKHFKLHSSRHNSKPEYNSE